MQTKARRRLIPSRGRSETEQTNQKFEYIVSIVINLNINIMKQGDFAAVANS